MDLKPIYKRVIGLDVHQKQITACALIEEDGQVQVLRREFGAFRRDRKALAQWAQSLAPEVVVMESTGIYWKSPYAALEEVGIAAWVVNARHVKAVPGRKTDVADAQWLATLARAGLLRASFVPPAKCRELRLVARQRQKLVGMCASEKNRLHKVLTDGGVRLAVLVSDMHGKSARAMVRALVAGRPVHEVLDCKGRLRASREELLEALSGAELSAAHRFVAEQILQHIDELEQRIAQMDQYLLQGLQPWQAQLQLLQTIPGIDLPGAAMLLVEIGPVLSRFASVKHFCPWLGLCPATKISGGKVLGSRTKRSAGRARQALKMAAMSLSRSNSALGAFYRRMCMRMDKPRANTAVAHKLARMVYFMLTRGEAFVDEGQQRYEEQQRQRSVAALKRRAAALGFEVSPTGAPRPTPA